MATNGSDLPVIDNLTPGQYYVVVDHRNHLPVMSRMKVSFETDTVGYDFTTSLDQGYTVGGDPMKTIGDKTVLWSGDAIADGNVQALDFNLYLNATSIGATGYEAADFNFDGVVQALDFNMYIANTLAGASSQVP